MSEELNYTPADEGDEIDTVILTLEDDTELECAILAIFPAGGNDYIALLPLDDSEEEEEGEVLLYRYVENGTDSPELMNIETDEEYEMAADAFDELLDDEEFEEEE